MKYGILMSRTIGIHEVGKASWIKREVGNSEVGKFEIKLERKKLENSSQSCKIFGKLL